MRERFTRYPSFDTERIRTMIRIGLTFKTESLADGAIVLKRNHWPMRRSQAFRAARIWHREWGIFRQFLWPYLAPTEMVLTGRSANRIHIVTVQPHIHGMPFPEAVRLVMQGHGDPRYIIDFLKRTLTMQQDTGLLPDIYSDVFRTHAAIRNIVDRWYPAATDNVLVVQTGDSLFPVLVDSGVSSKSKMPILKDIQNRPTVTRINGLITDLTAFAVQPKHF